MVIGCNRFVNIQLFNLACGPDKRIFRYTSYLINGWRFNTKERDLQLKSQNSGVFVKGDKSTEPYVLASQAEQVYYVKDIKDLNWQVAVKTKPCDLYDLPCENVREEPCQKNEELSFRFQEFNVGNDDDDDDVDRTHIERSLVNLDVIIGVEDEGDEFDHDEFTSINNEDDELESINDVDTYNDDDDD
ncbi:hypothetical protein V6N13_009488 [Hibiscus sabdariffa]